VLPLTPLAGGGVEEDPEEECGRDNHHVTPATSSTRFSNFRFLNKMALYDVAYNICLAWPVARHVNEPHHHTHF